MANMAYCRFYNTLQDLQDCYDHIDDEELSDDEQEARELLIELCKQIANDFSESVDRLD